MLQLKPWQQKFVKNFNSSREFYGSPGKPNSQNQKVRSGRNLSDVLQSFLLVEEALKPGNGGVDDLARVPYPAKRWQQDMTPTKAKINKRDDIN